jgi:hypothetical protein
MERECQISSQDSENVELKMTYFRGLPFLLIIEKVLTFISDDLDVFRMVSRHNNRRSCIAPDNSKLDVSDHRGSKGAHLAQWEVKPIPVTVVVQVSIFLAHQLTGSPRRPRRGGAGVS